MEKHCSQPKRERHKGVWVRYEAHGGNAQGEPIYQEIVPTPRH